MIYVVDIDNTICDTPVIDGRNAYEYAVPRIENINKINALYDEGHIIKYWTARGASTGRDWYALTFLQLNNWGCKFHQFDVGKPSYDVFVCDKAINERDFFKT